MYQAGLVLEGGGMKGIYTAGVLDFFLDKEIEFSNCYGVSAGACHLCSFLTKQKKRAYKVCTDYLDDKRYCGPYSLITTGNIFNAQLCYDLIPNYLNPFDYDEFNKYKGNAYVVVTNIVTGKPEYIRLTEIHEDMRAVQASASLPLVSKNVEYKGNLYLDGGISDSIPIRKSTTDGNQKNIVILTKEMGYRRKASEHLKIVKMRYWKYPHVYELMKNRHISYNSTLDYLDACVEEKQAFVIRPKAKSAVGRVEKDVEKLNLLYEEGYQDAADCYESMLAYLNK